MVRQKTGSIVNVSTTLVDHPVAGVPVTVQVMAKAGLNAVTRALAMEYVQDGIRVNTVALGVIKTPMHEPEAYDSRLLSATESTSCMDGFSPLSGRGWRKAARSPSSVRTTSLQGS